MDSPLAIETTPDIRANLQGYHGLVKTLANNVYYYQDELGSTSHITSATGALIESYQYDLYGKPRVYNSGGTYQPNATPVAKDLGNGGSRWLPELGLYDDRNRFMSPDLGRFIQPDPVGFKGDGSNLYRYCGNDWANRTDPMGLGERDSNPILQEQIRYNDQLRNSDRGAIMSQMLNVGRINVRDAVKDMQGFTMGRSLKTSITPRESFSASVLTAIHPPDAQTGVKSIQSVTVNSDGSYSKPDPYVGRTDFYVGKPRGSSNGSSADVRVNYPNFNINMRGHFTSAAYPIVQPIDYKVHITGNFITHKASAWGKMDGYPSGVIFGGGQRMYEWNQHARADLAEPMEQHFATGAVQW